MAISHPLVKPSAFKSDMITVDSKQTTVFMCLVSARVRDKVMSDEGNKMLLLSVYVCVCAASAYATMAG